MISKLVFTPTLATLLDLFISVKQDGGEAHRYVHYTFANLRDDPLAIRKHAPNMEKPANFLKEFCNKEVDFVRLLLGNFTKPEININTQWSLQET